MRRFLAGLFLAAFVLSAAQGAPEVTVAAYNLKNYLSMERTVDGKRELQAKPDREIAAVMQAMQAIKPDILGVCEMGTRADFEDMGKRLKQAGFNFTDSVYLEAEDDRHLALYSRYPIAARNEVKDLTYDLNGQVARVRRGFLDVTVQITDSYQLRLIGAHLKSKRPVPEGEALIRRHEAQLLRQRIEEILTADPQTNLLVYGDFNDTKNEPPISAIKGRRGSKNYMEDILVKDSVGDRWTHYWSSADQYSRFDYFFASKALMPEIERDKSYILRADYSIDGSDHRPIVTVIDAENR